MADDEPIYDLASGLPQLRGQRSKVPPLPQQRQDRVRSKGDAARRSLRIDLWSIFDQVVDGSSAPYWMDLLVPFVKYGSVVLDAYAAEYFELLRTDVNFLTQLKKNDEPLAGVVDKGVRPEEALLDLQLILRIAHAIVPTPPGDEYYETSEARRDPPRTGGELETLTWTAWRTMLANRIGDQRYAAADKKIKDLCLSLSWWQTAQRAQAELTSRLSVRGQELLKHYFSQNVEDARFEGSGGLMVDWRALERDFRDFPEHYQSQAALNVETNSTSGKRTELWQPPYGTNPALTLRLTSLIKLAGHSLKKSPYCQKEFPSHVIDTPYLGTERAAARWLRALLHRGLGIGKEVLGHGEADDGSKTNARIYMFERLPEASAQLCLDLAIEEETAADERVSAPELATANAVSESEQEREAEGASHIHFKYNKRRFGQIVRETRHKLGWTQATFASKIGTGADADAVSRYERGERHPSEERLHKIEEVVKKHHPKREGALREALASSGRSD